MGPPGQSKSVSNSSLAPVRSRGQAGVFIWGVRKYTGVQGLTWGATGMKQYKSQGFERQKANEAAGAKANPAEVKGKPAEGLESSAEMLEESRARALDLKAAEDGYVKLEGVLDPHDLERNRDHMLKSREFPGG